MAKGNPLGQIRAKPFREALTMEAKLAEAGEDTPAKEGSLRWIARQMLVRAGADTVTAVAVADRLDGKPAQAIVGGDEGDAPLTVVNQIELVGVRPSDQNSR